MSFSVMTSNEWLAKAVTALKENNIPTARLDALVLLSDELNKDKAYVLAHPDEALSSSQIKLLNAQINRRKSHEPIAYIRGKSEFYGREFIVSKDTLEPRPETEAIITLIKGHKNIKTIIDVGTGSGCIAITAKLLRPNASVYAVEINKSSMVIAQKNALKNHADVTFLHGNLLDPVPKQILDKSVLLCNLPYVPNKYELNEAAKHEPRIAIFGGDDGLDIYRQMFAQISELDFKPSYILTESLPFQHKTLTQIAKAAGYKLKTSEDFIQVFEN